MFAAAVDPKAQIAHRCLAFAETMTSPTASPDRSRLAELVNELHVQAPLEVEWDPASSSGNTCDRAKPRATFLLVVRLRAMAVVYALLDSGIAVERDCGTLHRDLHSD